MKKRKRRKKMTWNEFANLASCLALLFATASLLVVILSLRSTKTIVVKEDTPKAINFGEITRSEVDKEVKEAGGVFYINEEHESRIREALEEL
jgi:predicted transcriptional regulator